MTITGTGFVSGATVKFGTVAATAVAVSSSTTLTAKAPAQSAGTQVVYVSTPGGTSAKTNGSLYAYGPPAITAITPKAGPTAGGTIVTITGTGFVPDATVAFGTTNASVTYVSSTPLTATSPSQNQAGPVDITVTTTAGTSSPSTADQFSYDAVPTVTGVSPAAGPTAGANRVTITGTGFVSGATVKFGTVSGTSVTYVSATQITAVAPAQAAGTHNVYRDDPGRDERDQRPGR